MEVADLIEEDARNAMSSGEDSVNSSFSGDHEKEDEKTLLDSELKAMENSIKLSQQVESPAISELVKEQIAADQLAADQLADEQLADKTPIEDTCNEWIDVLGTGDLMKKIIRKGKSDVRPKAGELVKIVWNFLSNEEQEEQEIQFILGYGFHLRALELAVSLMSVGEVSYVNVNSRLVDDPSGKETYNYLVELLDVQPVDSFNLNFRIDEARECGNVYFKNGEYEKAYHLYEYGVNLLSIAGNDQSSDEVALRKCTLIANAAASLLKIKDWKKVVEITDNVPYVQSVDKMILAKLMLRRSEALIQLKNYEEAANSLTICLLIDPSNTYAKAMLEQAKNLKADDEKELKNVYKNMFKPPTTASEPINDEGCLSKVRSFMFSKKALIMIAIPIGVGAIAYHVKRKYL